GRSSTGTGRCRRSSCPRTPATSRTARCSSSSGPPSRRGGRLTRLSRSRTPLGFYWTRRQPSSAEASERPPSARSHRRSAGYGWPRPRSISVGAPDDLPKMAVQVAEVTGVDAPRPFAWRSDRRPGGFGLFEQRIHLGAALHELPQTELAGARRTGGNRCVLGEVAARIQVEEQPTLELEHRDGAIRAGFLVRPLRPEDAPRLEAEPVAIEP